MNRTAVGGVCLVVCILLVSCSAISQCSLLVRDNCIIDFLFNNTSMSIVYVVGHDKLCSKKSL